MGEFFFLPYEFATLLIALIIARFLVLKKHPILGYFIGLLLFPIVWLLYQYLSARGADCGPSSGVACEWLAVASLLVTCDTVLALVIYSALSISMIAYYRRVNSQGGLAESPATRRSLALMTILWVALMTILGCLVGLAIFNIRTRGLFIGWQSLGRPLESDNIGNFPGEKIIRIRSYNLGQIQVETDHSRIFQAGIRQCLQYALPERQNCWRIGQPGELITGDFVPCEPQFWIRQPPRGVIERVQSGSCIYAQIIQTSYALLEDGSVWAWTYTAVDPHDSAFPVIVGSLLGLVLGSITVLLRSLIK